MITTPSYGVDIHELLARLDTTAGGSASEHILRQGAEQAEQQAVNDIEVMRRLTGYPTVDSMMKPLNAVLSDESDARQSSLSKAIAGELTTKVRGWADIRDQHQRIAALLASEVLADRESDGSPDRRSKLVLAYLGAIYASRIAALAEQTYDDASA